MTLYPIECGNFKLDGGAMFGVVPKSIWSRTNPADGKNMIDLATRALLIETGNRLILIDTGMGNKQSDKFFSYYYRWGSFTLKNSLKQYGFEPNDVTDVFFTHLHFDHCGGAVEKESNTGKYRLTFPKAIYWSNKAHWLWATQPNPREKASFLSENLTPMEESGQLQFIEPCKEDNYSFCKALDFHIFWADGHTEKQMLPIIKYKNKTLFYAADLFPTAGHIPVSFVMGYDVRPLHTLKEKSAILERALEHDFYIFTSHDAHNELCTVHKTEKGIRLKECFTFNQIFN